MKNPKQQIKKAKTMIKKLASIEGVKESHFGTTAQFFDDDSNGIWFKAYFNPFVEAEISNLLDDCGWFIEPYDSGTLHAYRD